MKKIQPIKRSALHIVLGFCIFGFLSAAATAQQENPDEQVPVDQWRFIAGMGAVYQPKYPGSDDKKLAPFPALSASYGRFFVGGIPDSGIPLGIGAFLIQNSTWRVGVGLGHHLQKPRKESDSSHLNGLGDIDATALGSLFLSYNQPRFRVRAFVVTDLSNKGQGTRATVDLDAKYQVNDALLLTAGPGLTWADNDYTETFFGIDTEQSQRSGRNRYTAKGGVHSFRFGVGANYRITPQWGVNARYSLVNLRGDARNSPITDDKSQNTLSVFASYRF